MPPLEVISESGGLYLINLGGTAEHSFRPLRGQKPFLFSARKDVKTYVDKIKRNQGPC